MNYALSQRRTDRHPVGLVIVVGLHVLLAAVLLSARLAQPSHVEPVPVDLKPLDPVKPKEPDPEVLPKAPEPVLRQPTVLPPPVVTTEPPPKDTILVPTEPRPDPIVIADRGSREGTGDSDSIVHVTARAARLFAGSAECRPEYPAAAQRAGATGTTKIRFSVDATGRIAGSQILHASGPTRENRMMDLAAAEALAKCPVQVGNDEQGRPTGTTTDVEYVWSLN